MSYKVALDYLGCKVNQAEIEDLGRRFQQAGFSLADVCEAPDVYILNSCTVTHVADRKARLLIRQMARHNPNAYVIVTGCYATVDPGAAQAIEGVDLVVPNEDKDRLVQIVGGLARPSPPAAPPDAEPRKSVLSRTRAMLKVQDGCDHFCTYCIVPAARGGCRSVPMAEVVEQVRRRVDLGFGEVVLTGVALGSYGRDWGTERSLTELVAAVLHETAIERLRLSSVEPEYLDPAILDLWSDRRFCRHLHLPLQSGCDATLKRMGRRYSVAAYADLVARARAIAPDVAVTTDIIVGFPGETEGDAAESYSFVEAMGFARIHVFRFSPRRGTPAARLAGSVAEQAKKERAAAMLALATRSSHEYRRRFIGSRRQVLWEEQAYVPGSRADGAQWTGLTDNYLRVYMDSGASLHNQLTDVRLVAEVADGLIGTI